MSLTTRKNYVDITIEKYPTTFFYEKMKILADDFKNEKDYNFFKDINKSNDPDLAKGIAKEIGKTLRVKNYEDKNITTVTPVKNSKRKGIGTDCVNIIFTYIFKYNIQQLWYNNRNTVFIFPVISSSNDHGEKLLLFTSKMYSEILKKVGPFTDTDNSCTTSGSDKPDDDKINGNGNTIEFLNIISEDDEDIETFKTKLSENLKVIAQKIKEREVGDGSALPRCRQYRKIIYFVNKINGEEDPMFFKYYKKGLKKEYVSVLKEQLNKFFNSGKIGSQPTKTISISDNNSIEKLSKDIIIRDLKKAGYDYEQKDIVEHIDNIQVLLEKLKNCYKRETDENYKKSITTSDNSDIFNIFMRFNNLDAPVITDEIITDRNTLYKFKESGNQEKIGFFYASNLAKHQYIFNLDLIENKKYKVKNEITSKDKKTTTAQETEEETELRIEEEALEEALVANPSQEIKDSTRKTLIEVKLEFGKLTFRNIQKDIKSKYEDGNEITYYGQRKDYDYYRWFNHRMIDSSLTDNINIRFFKDTIYDTISFKAYLNSEKKLSKDTRVALEFLKINASPEILKYNDYIFNNFKGNINPNLYLLNDTNYIFEEKIKKGIVDILFEKNSLVYIKETKQITEKEKESASPQNYKIINYKYNPILGDVKNKENLIYKHFQQQVTTSVDEIELDYYKNIASLKAISSDSSKKIPSELLTSLVNTKKTLGILVVDVSKDVFSNPVSLYLAAECKTRSKRLKDTYYKFKRYFSGGTHKRFKKIKKKTKKNRNKNKNKRIKTSRKPRFITKYRHI
jgi:hypothetical protein